MTSYVSHLVIAPGAVISARKGRTMTIVGAEVLVKLGIYSCRISRMVNTSERSCGGDQDFTCFSSRGVAASGPSALAGYHILGDFPAARPFLYHSV